MFVTALSSLSLFARDNALRASYQGLLKSTEGAENSVTALSLQYIDPPAGAETGPDPDFPEAGENPSRIYFNLELQKGAQKSQETLCVIGDCISCAANALLPEILEKVETEHLVLALPAGVSLNGLISYIRQNSAAELSLASARFAGIAGELDRDLWSSQTLAERGVSGSCMDERTPGEFIIKELMLADTLITSAMPFEHHCSSQEAHLQELIGHIAPHLRVVATQEVAQHAAICGCYDLNSSSRRTEPGYLHVPGTLALTAEQAHGQGQECSPACMVSRTFTTVVLSSDKLIDAEKLAKQLKKIVRHAYRVHGRVWMSGFEQEIVALEGIGPQTWLQSQGSWDAQTPGTLLALTGKNLDPFKLQELLDSCAITGDELLENLLGTSA